MLQLRRYLRLLFRRERLNAKIAHHDKDMAAADLATHAFEQAIEIPKNLLGALNRAEQTKTVLADEQPEILRNAVEDLRDTADNLRDAIETIEHLGLEPPESGRRMLPRINDLADDIERVLEAPDKDQPLLIKHLTSLFENDDDLEDDETPL